MHTQLGDDDEYRKRDRCVSARPRAAHTSQSDGCDFCHQHDEPAAAPSSPSTPEIEVPAYLVNLEDYLAGVGRIKSKTSYGKRVTLRGEGGDWKLDVHKLHPLVVLRP